MQSSAVRQSIEALYQEAEAVVHDGAPMMAIIKSFPPTEKIDADPVVTLSLVGKSDINVKQETVNSDQDSLRRINDLWREAEALANEADENVQQVLGDDNIEAGSLSAQPPVDLVLDDLPAQPPAPSDIAGADQLNDQELDRLLQDAQADIDAIAPATHTDADQQTDDLDHQADSITDPNEQDNIETVMADIAAAVGVTPETDGPVPLVKTESNSDSGGDSDSDSGNGRTAAVNTDTLGVVGTTPTPVQPENLTLNDTQTDQFSPINAELATFVGDTVRAVLSEELPTMVRAALKDVLGDFKISSMPKPTKAKSTAKAASKKPSDKKVVKKKAASPKTKTAAKKTAAKKLATK